MREINKFELIETCYEGAKWRQIFRGKDDFKFTLFKFEREYYGQYCNLCGLFEPVKQFAVIDKGFILMTLFISPRFLSDYLEKLEGDEIPLSLFKEIVGKVEE